MDNSQDLKVEVNGVNPVPASERYGKPSSLFPIWFSWNVSIMGIGYGIYVYALGLSITSAIIAGILGYAISTAIVGVMAVGGVKTGLPTLIQTRFAFGIHGNRLPSFFAFVSNTGWQICIISLASTSLASLFAALLPSVFANESGSASVFAIILCFIINIVIVMYITIYGYNLILKAEKYIAYITGVMTIIFLALIAPHIHFDSVAPSPDFSIEIFIGGVIMAMTMVGIGFLNCGGDFSRYLPVDSKNSSVIGWTALGISLPVSVLLIIGVLLAATNPSLSDKAAADPILALTELLPFWFFVPFSLVIVMSLLAANIVGVYSSGLALLAIGCGKSRLVSTIITAIVLILGAIYILFISESFLATFQAFLATVSVVMGAMASIEIVDFIRQKQNNWSPTMALSKQEGGSDYRWGAIITLVFSSLIGLGTIISWDPYIAKMVGFFLSDEAKQSVLAQANIGVILSMVISAVMYYIITYVLHIENKK